MNLRVLALAGLLLPLAAGYGGPPAPAPAGYRVTDPQWTGTVRPVPLAVHSALLGRMRITEVIAPPAVGPVAPALVAAAPVLPAFPPVPPQEMVLVVRKWSNGRFIDDSIGRRWVLVYGGPQWGNPEQVAGWLLPSNTDVPHFFSRSGRLWRLQFDAPVDWEPKPKAAVPPVGPRVPTPVDGTP